jgi:hypothetical protein
MRPRESQRTAPTHDDRTSTRREYKLITKPTLTITE